MTTMTLSYGRGPTEMPSISTVEQLDEALDAIDAEAQGAGLPVSAVLTDEKDRSLSMGLGRDFRY